MAFVASQININNILQKIQFNLNAILQYVDWNEKWKAIIIGAEGFFNFLFIACVNQN